MVRALREFTTPAATQAEILAPAELAAISAPTLVVWGTRDRFFPTSHAKRLAVGIANARVRLLDAGHSPNWEAPAALAAAITEFLNGAGTTRDGR
jgi:pimeloyl-ACP methyl ester carboxylesterase